MIEPDCETCLDGLRLKALYYRRRQSSKDKRAFKKYRRQLGQHCFPCIYNKASAAKTLEKGKDLGIPSLQTYRTIDLYRPCPMKVDENGDEYWDIPDEVDWLGAPNAVDGSEEHQ